MTTKLPKKMSGMKPLAAFAFMVVAVAVGMWVYTKSTKKYNDYKAEMAAKKAASEQPTTTTTATDPSTGQTARVVG